ncbi:MAG: hypothetical protein R6W70_09365 [bacterium]
MKVSRFFLLLLSVFLLFNSCDNMKSGSFELNFKWEEGKKPDFESRDYYLWVKITAAEDAGKI